MELFQGVGEYELEPAGVELVDVVQEKSAENGQKDCGSFVVTEIAHKSTP